MKYRDDIVSLEGEIMSTYKKTDDTSPSVNLDLTGKNLRRREQQVGVIDPYDSRRTFEAVKEPREIFRRRREDGSEEPQEREKRIKFEIVDDPKGPKGGYNPYDTS
jgi:hypothetical protein